MDLEAVGATIVVARKEVMTVPTGMLAKNERAVSEPTPITPLPEDELREWARKHIEHVRRLKLHIAAFVFGMVVLTPLWALVEWNSNGGFERWSDNSQPGDWEPWILYIAIAWGLWVAFVGLRVYLDRPTTEAEIEREVARLKAR